MRGQLYQIVLIVLGVVVAALFGVFVYREMFPEYALYQDDYIALEEFRSTYTGEAPPIFKKGIKQIVLEDKNKGPEEIDRCISCHVALDFQHFSPTKIDYDINGNMKRDAKGYPLQVPNEEYVWEKLDRKIADLQDVAVNDRLESEGKSSEVLRRKSLAAEYEKLKTVKVGGYTYDTSKVLRMHPLMGKETRPFQFHPIEEYGCSSCHGGNGRGLTTDTAHGPVFDGMYEEEFMGHSPVFLEKDPANDPLFSKVFNHKPGHTLLFQTTPILIGSLIEAKCIQCHQPTSASLQNAYRGVTDPSNKIKEQFEESEKSYQNDLQHLATLLELRNSLKEKGFFATYTKLQQEEQNYAIPQIIRKKPSKKLTGKLQRLSEIPIFSLILYKNISAIICKILKQRDISSIKQNFSK